MRTSSADRNDAAPAAGPTGAGPPLGTSHWDELGPTVSWRRTPGKAPSDPLKTAPGAPPSTQQGSGPRTSSRPSTNASATYAGPGCPSLWCSPHKQLCVSTVAPPCSPTQVVVLEGDDRVRGAREERGRRLESRPIRSSSRFVPSSGGPRAACGPDRLRGSRGRRPAADGRSDDPGGRYIARMPCPGSDTPCRTGRRGEEVDPSTDHGLVRPPGWPAR